MLPYTWPKESIDGNLCLSVYQNHFSNSLACLRVSPRDVLDVCLYCSFFPFIWKKYVVCLPRSLHNLKKTFVPEIVLIHCKMKVFYVFPIGYLSVRWSQFPLVYISEFCYREYTLYFVIMKSISWFCCKSDADTVTVLVTFHKRRVSNPAIYSS